MASTVPNDSEVSAMNDLYVIGISLEGCEYVYEHPAEKPIVPIIYELKMIIPEIEIKIDTEPERFSADFIQ